MALMKSPLPFGRLPSEAWKDPLRLAMTSHLPFGRLLSEAWKDPSRHAMTSHLPFRRHDDVTTSLRKAPFRSLEGYLATRDDVTPSLRKA
ncbi:unnamed protein product [Prunus armeniaca]